MNNSKEITANNLNTSKIDNLIKSGFLKQLSGLKDCYLEITDPQGRYMFGDIESELHASMSVKSLDVYKAITFQGSVGAAEQFIYKNWDTPNLTKLVRVFVRNRELLDKMEGGSAWLKNTLLKITHFFNKNTESGSKRNISAHYDLGNDLFRLFLDNSMMYSSAIFKTSEMSLESASRYKLKTICEKLDLSAADSVIEIGTGWGGFAIYAAENYGCHVTTTTISNEQYSYTKKMVEQKNLTDKITLLKKDYRELTGKYDKLVSIEMIEAVGHHYLPTYLKKCNSLLKKDGMALIQAITIEDYRYKNALKNVDFIKKYIFPGSFIPSISEILKVSSQHTQLKLFNLEDFGMSYAKTLNAWKRRFNDKSEELRNLGYDDDFQRMWNFYFSYCEGGFIEQSISVVHLLFTQPQTQKEPVFTIV